MTDDTQQQGECADMEHRWSSASSALAGSFRFCLRCDREEWENGTVRPGWRLAGESAC